MINELIKSLSSKEQKLFLKYIQHKTNSKKRKDVMIFQYLLERENTDTKKLVEYIYGEYSQAHADSYYSLKNILKTQLENFILQQKDNSNPQLQVSRFVNLAQKLYYNRKHKPAWNYLLIAEDIALKAEEYELLNQIYQHMIEYSWTQPSNVLRVILKKEKNNRSKAKVNRSINIALSVINNELNTFHHSGVRADIDKIIQSALKEFDVQETVRSSASQYFKLAMLVKIQLVEKKEYKELYKYLIRTLTEMEEAKLFNKYNYKYKIELMNIICYSAVRAGNYLITEKYIQLIEEENKKYPKTDLLTISSFMAKVVCLGISGRIDESIKVLEYLSLKYRKLYQYDDVIFFGLNSNLATAYLYLNKVSNSRKHIQELLNNSKRILRLHGLKGLFNCYAIECLLAVESGDLTFAEYRIKSIERKFKKILQQTHNYRNQAFLKLLRYIINNNLPWSDEKFKKDAWKFIYLQPIYKLGDEFISFNAWLYSKLENVPYDEGEYNKKIKEKIKEI